MNDNLNENPNANVNEPGDTNPTTPPTPEPAGMPVIQDDEKKWAMFCHIGGFALFLNMVIPFGHIVVPLILWLLKKSQSAFIDEQGKEAMNFQISMTIYLFVAIILSFILIGIPILIALVIFDIVMMIKAANAVTNGQPFHYPYAIRLI